MKELTSPEQKLSYAIGMDVGESLQQVAEVLDIPALLAGIEAMLSDNEPLLQKHEATEIKQEFAGRLQAAQNKALSKEGVANATAGQEFLEATEQIEGIVKTDSGLMYQEVEAGDGNSPSATDTVVVHYTGSLIDGMIFDSSVQRGEPVSFPVNGVIPGWTEALQLMSVGSKFMLYIPPELGYGESGAGGTIGPNATLVFEVELLGIEQE